MVNNTTGSCLLTRSLIVMLLMIAGIEANPGPLGMEPVAKGAALKVDVDNAACEVNNGAHKPGISPTSMANYYTEWARRNTYEKDLCPGTYNGPTIAATFMEKYCGDQKDALILDIAAGTGLVGQQLKKRGYTNLDALDPSEGMLEAAEKKGIYGKLICEYLTEEPVKGIKKGTYNYAVTAGGLGEGHIPSEALREMARLVKPGGIMIIVMREEYLSYVKQYVCTLEPLMEKMEREGKWELKERTIVPHYSFNKNGVVFVYQILV